MLIRPVSVSLVMLHVNAFIENLTEADSHRFEDAEETVQQRGTEVRVMNEIVGYTVDVPGNADRIDKPEDQHQPQGRAREKIEHPVEINAVKKSRAHGNRIPTRMREDMRVRPGAFDAHKLA